MDASENIYAWFLTWTTEFLIWQLWLSRSPVRLLFTSLLVNSITQPAASAVYHAWLLSLPDYRGGHDAGILAIVEAGVLLVEWILIRWLLPVGWQRAFWIALTANSVTAVMSFLWR
jgi:hypothetical protein